MNKVVLGSVLGAAGLVAAALLSENEDDKQELNAFDLSKKMPGKTIDKIQKQLAELNNFIVKLILEESSLYLELGDLVSDCSLEGESVSFLEKVQNYIHEGSFIFLRQSLITKLNELKQKSIQVVASYKDVIVFANQHLLCQTQEPVSFENVAIENENYEVDNSLDNNSWKNEVNSKLDRIGNYLDEASEQVTLLKSKLELTQNS